jgi:hypothetical protein
VDREDFSKESKEENQMTRNKKKRRNKTNRLVGESGEGNQRTRRIKTEKEVEGKRLDNWVKLAGAYTFTFTTTPKLVPIVREVYHGCNDRRRH